MECFQQQCETLGQGQISARFQKQAIDGLQRKSSSSIFHPLRSQIQPRKTRRVYECRLEFRIQSEDKGLLRVPCQNALLAGRLGTTS